MAKGSTGAETSTIIRMKKPEQIPCDCQMCRHSKKGAGTIYCTYYDEFSPNKKTCARYWGPGISSKSRKTKVKKSKNNKLSTKK